MSIRSMTSTVDLYSLGVTVGQSKMADPLRGWKKHRDPTSRREERIKGSEQKERTKGANERKGARSVAETLVVVGEWSFLKAVWK